MKNGLTKEHALILQGVAILMMLYHHLFCIPERLHTQYISILNFNAINVELKLAWLFKMCVAIYAFISGYGLYITSKKFNGNCVIAKEIILNDYRFIIRKLISFYKLYWFIFIIFVPIGFIFFNRSFHIGEFMKNFVGISSSYNEEWWYVYQYISMLLIFPFIDAFLYNYKSKRVVTGKILVILLGIILMLLALKIELLKNILVISLGKINIGYMLVFIVGCLFAKLNIFAKTYEYLMKYNVSEKILAFVILLIVISIRTILADKASYSRIDFILVPFFIYAVLTIITLYKIENVFKLFGEYSIFMWLTHTFLCYYYFQKIIVSVKISTLIYIWLVFLSLLISWCLDKLYNHITNCLQRSKLGQQSMPQQGLGASGGSKVMFPQRYAGKR